MRPILTAVIAALEAVSIALLGLVVVAVPAGLLWVLAFDLSAQPAEVLGASVAVWLLAHFTPLVFAIGPEAALGLGLAPEALSVPISLAPLGITLLTTLLAARSGWRFGHRGGVGAAGVLGGALGFAAAATFVAPLAGGLVTRPLWLTALFIALVFAVPSALAFLVRAIRDEQPWWNETTRQLQRAAQRIGIRNVARVRPVMNETLRLTVAAALGCVALGALGIAVALTVGYVDITALSQSLQLDPIGAVLLFLVQLALLPVAIIWAIAWFSGVGFALGTGTSVSPFETLLGPLPSIPLLGAIPQQGWGGAGALAPALLVLIGAIVGAFATRRFELRRGAMLTSVLMIPLLAALLTGLLFVAVFALASGAVGPDRLEATGVDPWLAGGLAAAELGVGMMLGVAAGRIDRSRLSSVLASTPIARWTSNSDDAVTASVAEDRLPTGFSASSQAWREDPVSNDAPTLDLDELRDPSEFDEFSMSDEVTMELDETIAQAEEAASPRTDDAASAPAIEEPASLGVSDWQDPWEPEAGPDEGQDPDASDAESHVASTEPDGGDEANELDESATEELLRAYSWDQPELSSEDRPRRSAWSSWRLPKRKR